MPRGGSRPGAGRRADPNSKNQQKLRKKAEAEAKVLAEFAAASGAVAPTGKKPAGAESWPFGVAPPAPPAAAEESGEDAPEIVAQRDPIEFLLDVMQGHVKVSPAQLQAAVAAAPYLHAKKATGIGKKDEAATKAKEAARGKFGVRQPPGALKVIAGGG